MVRFGGRRSKRGAVGATAALSFPLEAHVGDVRTYDAGSAHKSQQSLGPGADVGVVGGEQQGDPKHEHRGWPRRLVVGDAVAERNPCKQDHGPEQNRLDPRVVEASNLERS